MPNYNFTIQLDCGTGQITTTKNQGLCYPNAGITALTVKFTAGQLESFDLSQAQGGFSFDPGMPSSAGLNGNLGSSGQLSFDRLGTYHRMVHSSPPGGPAGPGRRMGGFYTVMVKSRPELPPNPYNPGQKPNTYQ